MKISAPSFYVTLFVLLLSIVSILYKFNVIDIEINNYNISNTLSHIGNIHDHLIYEEAFINLPSIDPNLSLLFNNNYSIAIFYRVFHNLIPIDISFPNLVLIINIIIYILFWFSYNKICIEKKIHNGQYLFLLNLPIIYFIPLANKDILYMLFISMILLNYIRGKFLHTLFWGALCVIFARYQILITLFLLFIISLKNISIIARFLICYFITAAIGVISFKFIVGGADLGSGISTLTKKINDSYYIGNFLLNPIRLFQYIVEFYITPAYIFNTNVSYINLFILPYVIYFTLSIPKIKKLLDIKNNIFSRFTLCLIMTLLAIPIINLRYLIILFPFIILALNYDDDSYEKRNIYAD